MTTGLLRGLGRFSAAHPWSHNDAYTPWIMRHARKVRRAGGLSALDVGCGTGNLLRKLADVMHDLTGIEPDVQTAMRARANLADINTATVHQASFEAVSLGQPSYDLVTFVAVLHHMPLTQTLAAARSLVRPGGRLVIVGLARETPADLPWSVASVFLNPLIGAVRHPRRARETPENMTAPTAEPQETFEQIVDAARAVIPSVKIRRSLFWRYTAVWVAPVSE
ncbi:class I SAM-dependent methyltransferase [Rathayibacter sp. CAU 1779]